MRLDTGTETLMIRDTLINSDGSDGVAKKNAYRGIQVLYELLFKKHYTQEAEKTINKLYGKPKANRHYYKPNKQIDKSKLNEYKNIIKKTNAYRSV